MGLQLTDRELGAAQDREERRSVSTAEVAAEIDFEVADEVLGRHLHATLLDGVAESEYSENAAIRAVLSDDWCEFGRLVGPDVKDYLIKAIRNRRGY